MHLDIARYQQQVMQGVFKYSMTNVQIIAASGLMSHRQL